jgi:hypothetical protein
MNVAHGGRHWAAAPGAGEEHVCPSGQSQSASHTSHVWTIGVQSGGSAVVSLLPLVLLSAAALDPVGAAEVVVPDSDEEPSAVDVVSDALSESPSAAQPKARSPIIIEFFIVPTDAAAALLITVDSRR